MKVRFGDIRFDSDTRQLSRESRELHVSGKAFELLKLLLERRPNAVSKADIQEYLWPDTFLSETNLPSLVTEIREAIGDDARHPLFIRTLHGFGYAFSGEVTDGPSWSRAPRCPRGLPRGWCGKADDSRYRRERICLVAKVRRLSPSIRRRSHGLTRRS